MFVRRSLGLLLVASAFVAALAIPTAASSKDVSDPRDQSAGTPLDISSVTVATHRLPHDFGIGTSARQHLLSLRVDTYDPFDDADLQDIEGELPAMSLHFDLNHDGKFDRMLFVQAIADATGYEIKAEMTKNKGKPIHHYFIGDKLVGYAEVWRPTTSSVEVEFPYSLLGIDPGDVFRWQARAASQPQPGVVEIDYGPDRLVKQKA